MASSADGKGDAVGPPSGSTKSKRRTDEQELTNLYARALEKGLRGKRKAINDLFDKHPDSIKDVHDYLENHIGFRVEPWKRTNEAPKVRTPRRWRPSRTRGNDHSNKFKKKKQKPLQLGSNGRWSSGTRQRSAISVQELSRFCTAVCPGTLAAPNLRHMLQKCGRGKGKELLLNMLEYLCGVPSHYALPPSATESEFIKFLIWCHQNRNSPGNMVPLNPSWPTDGVYEYHITVEDGLLRMFVSHKLYKEAKEVPETILNVDDHSKLYVDFNWSEISAALKSKCPTESHFCFRIAGLWAEPVRTHAYSKFKQMLTLSDGPENI